MSIPSTTVISDARILGKEHLPAEEAFLLIPSLLSHSDLLTLERILSEREIHYLMDEDAVLAEATRSHIEREGARTLVIGGSTDVAAYASAIQSAVAAGGVVIYLPSETVSICAPLTVIPGAKLDFLLKAGVPVVPTYVFHPLDTAMPIDRAPSASEAIIAFEPALSGAACTLPAFQEALFRLSELTFSLSPALDRSLGYALIQGLKKFGSINSIIDGKDGSVLPFNKVFAAALALSRFIRQDTQKKRVGIVLPPSPICLIANVAVILAGKVPVNLNFTAGRALCARCRPFPGHR
jgi:acyl-[acyl-carrier-protein]-phospholipid O-acyltransferase / long-chain-fatty-acid--[acyl-carrier-protein] ligase